MKIKGTTKITGVFGYPVSHSLSPVFQNAAFDSLSLDFVYIPFEVSSGPLLLKELNTSKGISSIINGEAGMLMSFSAPLSLTLIIISMLIMIALLTKSVREYLCETSLGSSLKS